LVLEATQRIVGTCVCNQILQLQLFLLLILLLLLLLSWIAHQTTCSLRALSWKAM
jgi:hypothetical protein